jgi:hypothetical protein
MMCKHFEWAMLVVKQDDKGYLALTKESTLGTIPISPTKVG